MSRWAHLLEWPKTIDSPEMVLIGDDHENLVIGRGKLEVADPQTFTYELTGQPLDIGHTLRRINEMRASPYDGRARCRLLITVAEGVEMNAGWTIPVIDTLPSGQWRCRGSSDALSIGDTATGPARTELTFQIPVQSQSFQYFTRFCAPSRRLTLLGTEIEFTFNPIYGTLKVYSNASEDLPATFTENWLAEPFRIMLGELIYPRLVVRVLGDGHAHVQMRSSPGHTDKSNWIALWQGKNALIDADGFWSIYADLLHHVASARDERGHRNFEPNKLTQHYEELMQAAAGSRWVWALTLASTAEALVLEIFPRGSKYKVADTDAIRELSEHIRKWTGDNNLKSTAIQAVKRTGEIAAAKGLALLREQGIVNDDGVASWKDIRNSVMHGSLVSRYSDEEEDKKIIALAGLVHSLTKHVVALERCARV